MSRGDALGRTLARAVLERAPAPTTDARVLQRVHFPKLRGVIAAYAEEIDSASRAIFPVKDKIETCSQVHDAIANKSADDEVTIKARRVPGLIGITSAFSLQTKSATLPVREWRDALEQWRTVLNSNYFAKPSPTPKTYPGPLPADFTLSARHDAWLTHVLTTRGVQRDSAAERQATEVRVVGGRLVRYGIEEHPPVDTSAGLTWWRGVGWEMFVMSHEGRLHMASHVIGRRHHSSLLGRNADGPAAAYDVAAAGEMKVVGGKIEQISLKTGHYVVGVEHLRQVVHLLTKRGADLTKTKLLDFKLNVISEDARTWWRTEGKQAYEVDKTLHTLKTYRDMFGSEFVDAALRRAGWYRKTKPGSRAPIWVDVRGVQATAKDIRKALKAELTDKPVAPLTTVGEVAEPRQASLAPAIDAYSVR